MLHGSRTFSQAVSRAGQSETMSVSCGSRGFCSIQEIERPSQQCRARTLLLCSSQISLSRKWNVREGDLRLRQRASLNPVTRQRWILCARSSLTEDAENYNPGKPENAADSLDIYPPKSGCVRVGVIRGGLSGGKRQRPEFVYTRAKPEVRWPHKSEELFQQRIARESGSAGRPRLPDWEELSRSDAGFVVQEEERVGDDGEAPRAELLEREDMVRRREAFRQRQKGQARRLQSMSKLALRKATDLKSKARRLATAIYSLELARPVTDVLDVWPEQLNNDELAVVVRNVGDRNWSRALELYEWLNLRQWYTPNPRLLATILHILGKANQVEAARELFLNADPEISSCIQVFNAILGVYAKQGQWEAVEQILELIEQRGCEPDIVTFNTIANARCKFDLQPGMASALLKEIELAGLRSDIVTYNTLLGGCIANKNFTEAAEIVKEMEQRGFDLDACSSYGLGKKYLNLGEDQKPVLSISQQEAFSNDVQDISDDGSVQQTTTPVVMGNTSKYVTSNVDYIEIPRFQAEDLQQMVALYTSSPEAVYRPADESRFSAICLFIQWNEVHAISLGDQGMHGLGSGPKRLGRRKLRFCRILATGWINGDFHHNIARESYKQLHICKAAQVPAPCTDEAIQMISDVGQSENELVQITMEDTPGDVVQTASSYTKLINEFMTRKDYSSGLEHLTEMVEAGIKPGYMTWICILQACAQCADRIALFRLLAALRDAGCPVPLRLIMEREAAMAEVEEWFRYLQATAADAGQGMVNVLVDILWAFKLRATAGRIYDLAIRLDIYPRNFSRVEEKNWEADLRSFSPGTALVAMYQWFIEMQKASLDGFPDPPKEVLMITGTQGYLNGVSLNKSIRAHLWEMGSPFYMQPPREGALISKGHALRLWLKDSPRCFNLDLEDCVMLPKMSSMSFFKGAWMSSDAVPVMKQIHTSIGEVWPRRYSKLVHMSATKRTEALAARIENEERRRLEKRERTDKPTEKKKQPFRRKE